MNCIIICNTSIVDINVLWNFSSVSQSDCIMLHFSSNIWEFQWLYILTNMGLVQSFLLLHKCELLLILVCIYLMTSDVEHFPYASILIFICGEVSVKIFCSCLLGYFLNIEVCVLNISFQWDIWFAYIFSQSMLCFIILLSVLCKLEIFNSNKVQLH